MSGTVRKITIVFVCLIGLLFGVTSSGEAGVIPWLYNAIFGPVPGGYYGGYYGGMAASPYSQAPCAAPGCSVVPSVPSVSSCSPCNTTFYRPRVAFYPPFAPPPWAYSCSPCGIASCATGTCQDNCQVSSSAKVPEAADSSELPVPKTFVDEAKKPEPTTPVDEGFRPRASGKDKGKPTQTKAFKVPETVIPKKQPAPTEVTPDAATPADKTAVPTKPETSDTSKKSSAVPPKSPKLQDAQRLPIPSLHLDEKVTWHVVPARTRLTLRSHFVRPVVVRHVKASNADWLPVPKGTQIAKK